MYCNGTEVLYGDLCLENLELKDRFVDLEFDGIIKVKVKVNFILEQVIKPQRGIRCIALIVHNLGAT